MCLNINHEYHNCSSRIPPPPLVAKKNITVYKILLRRHGFWLSPHQKFRYQEDFIYYITDEEPFSYSGGRGCWDVDRGLHAYSKYSEAIIHRSFDRAIWKCIVPKGSLYYMGDRNEIVSNQLQIIEEKMYKHVSIY